MAAGLFIKWSGNLFKSDCDLTSSGCATTIIGSIAAVVCSLPNFPDFFRTFCAQQQRGFTLDCDHMQQMAFP
jgi:hypothetical protein